MTNTRGTIVNKTTGQTLTGDRTSYKGGAKTFVFQIDGTDRQYGGNSFGKDEWDFTPDRPSPQEQWDALPIPSMFTIVYNNGEHPRTHLVKASSDEYLRPVSGHGASVHPITLLFTGGVVDFEEVKA